jgi:stress response protein YsnF
MMKATYDLERAERQTIKLYQERLIADKVRRKIGEIAIGNHVETETATVAISIATERVVIEHPPGDGAPVDPSEANFQTAPVIAWMEIYEETPTRGSQHPQRNGSRNRRS